MSAAGSSGRPAAGTGGRGGTGPSAAAGGAAGTVAVSTQAGGGAGGTGAGGAGPSSDGGVPSTRTVVGLWGGPGRDVVLNARFNICLRIDQEDMPGPGGQAWYRGVGNASVVVNCETAVSFTAIEGELFKFREVVTNGTGCYSPADIVLRYNPDGSLNFDWYRPGQTAPQETGTLRRVDTCEGVMPTMPTPMP